MNINPPVLNKIETNVCEIKIEQNPTPATTQRTNEIYQISDFDKVFLEQLEELKNKSSEYELKMKELEKHRRYLQKEFGIGKKRAEFVQPTHESIEDKESMNIMSSINQPEDEEF